MTGERVVRGAGLASLLGVGLYFVGAIASAATFSTQDEWSHLRVMRLQLALVSQATAGARVGILVLLAAGAVVLLTELRPDLGPALPTTVFAVAVTHTVLAAAGTVNFALAWSSEVPMSARAGAAVSMLASLPLSALACWLTAPGNLSAAGSPPGEEIA
jgi:hypothetical protein